MRALFASIGAGISLVAAAALSLLAVSAVFAFGGWSDPVTESARRPALVIADANRSAAGAAARRRREERPVVLPKRARPKRAVAPRAAAPPRSVRTTRSVTKRPAPRPPSAPALNPVKAPPVAKPSPAPAPAPKATTGERVRDVGENLSGTVESTGTALAEATASLVPPVGNAVQEVLNAVADIVRRSTKGLGSVVDGLLPKR